MHALVLYDTEFGNTERVARAIADGLADGYTVQLAPTSEPAALPAERPDLLLIGGPTQRHGLSPRLRNFLAQLPKEAWRGVPAATFDTRYRVHKLLTGSAAEQAAGRLRRAGCRLLAPPESFFMEQDHPPRDEKRRHELEALEPGEIERATAWARDLAAAAAR